MDTPVALVTGANSGIGKATAEGLLQEDYHVVLWCRSQESAARTEDEVRRSTGSDATDTIAADLTDFDAIRDAAQIVKDRYDRLDVLVNNAGVLKETTDRNEEGVEETFAVNYLAPFLLSHLLLPLLTRTADAHGEARIVNVGSDAHRGALRFDADVMSEGDAGLTAYMQSKLALVLFTNELARRLKPTGVTVNCVHPGVVATNIWRGPGVFSWLARRVKWFFNSPETGAEGPLYLATSDDVKDVTGAYFDETSRTKPAVAAFDEKAAAELWHRSMDLVDLDPEDTLYEPPDM
ncbi:MAG: SDR family oxidoreductase [Longimonas sp.]|uniref:SDR family oxidoreductase n=1 Tax=Longimonas sp. TaxID=2039626 RepID=UPI00335A7335